MQTWAEKFREDFGRWPGVMITPLQQIQSSNTIEVRVAFLDPKTLSRNRLQRLYSQSAP